MRTGPAYWGVVAGLVIASALAYARVTEFPFLAYDDQVIVSHNPLVTSGFTRESVSAAMTTSVHGNWQPVTWFSHMLDIELFGQDAGGHHLTSLLIHIAATLALFWALVSLTGALGRSAFVAAVFALHPSHVESVAWVAERKDVLSAFFAFTAIGLWGHWVRSRSRTTYAAVFALSALGMMSKAMVVTLPAILLLVDLWPLRRAQLRPLSGLLPLLAEKAPLFALSVLVSAMTLSTQASGINEAVPLLDRLTNALVNYVRYLGITLWPFELGAFYPGGLHWRPWEVAAALAALLSISTATLLSFARAPYLAFGWFWFVGTLVPVVGLLQVGQQSIACRYLYLPLVGVAIAASWGLHALVANKPQLRRGLVIPAVAVLALLLSLTRAQAEHYQSDKALWEHTLAVTEDNWWAHTMVGGFLIYDGELDNAIWHLHEALRLKPGYASAHFRLGIAYQESGDSPASIEQLREAVRLKPTYGSAHFRLGIAYQGNNEPLEALEEFEIALESLPEQRNLLYRMGLVLTELGRAEEAIARFRGELALNAQHSGAAGELARLLAVRPNPTQDEIKEALAFGEHAARLTRFAQPKELFAFALALGASGRNQQALDAARSAQLLAYEAGDMELSASMEAAIREYVARTQQ